jgi:hypothetical protein
VADFTGEGEFRWLHMHPSAKGQLTLTGKARIRRTDVEWLGGELEAQLQLAEDGKTISRVWKRYKATLTPRPKPDLTEWVERILEHGTGN